MGLRYISLSALGTRLHPELIRNLCIVFFFVGKHPELFDHIVRFENIFFDIYNSERYDNESYLPPDFIIITACNFAYVS